MSLLAGRVHHAGEGWREGWVEHDGARVVDAGDGAPPRAPDVEGFVAPAPVNAHTHVGDRVGRGIPLDGMSLAEVVQPPHGLKHRLLRETPRAKLVEGVREALREMDEGGTRAFIDFREGGLDGIALLREAASGSPARPVVLGRCAGAFREDEAERVLDACDGYGYSGLGDAADDAPERAAALARRRGKLFAMHVSEGAREDLARALDLRPTFLVHGVRLTADDVAMLAASRVPLVLCPRSNLRFGPLPDVPALLRAGVSLAVGSDNAMFHPMDVLTDARLLAARFPDEDASLLLDACLVGGRRLLPGAAPAKPWERGEATDVVVLDGDPLGQRAPRVLWRSWTKG